MSRFAVHTLPAAGQAQRRRELGHIHQGCTALGWSEDDYRFHLTHLTGKDSAADLDAEGRAKVLAHMATLGFKPKATGFKPFGQAEKIEWLWRQLDKAGGLRDASPEAMLSFVGRTAGVGVSHVKFLGAADASKVIEALKSMLDRAKRQAASA
jgi:phage gp16-like protein